MTEMSHPGTSRIDLQLVADMVSPASRVLDIGCGDGELLMLLRDTKGVDGRGMELSQKGVNLCVAKGLSVVQGDADTDLEDYPSDAFDFVILSQTLQAVHQPRRVLEQMVRIGRHAIVSFPNFGHWRLRLNLLLEGRMPSTELLDQPWYETANIHLCTVRDFLLLSDEMNVCIDRAVAVDEAGRTRDFRPPGSRANWRAAQAIFLLSKNGL